MKHQVTMIRKSAGALLLGLVLCLGIFFQPAPAQATDDLEALESKVAELSAAYEEAAAKAEDLKTQKTDTEARIVEIELLLTQKQDEYSRAMQNLYMSMPNRSEAIMAILNAGSLKDTIRFIDDYSWMLEHDYAILDEVSNLNAELKDTRRQLTVQLRDADSATEEAEEALEAAEKARDEAMERIAAEAAAAASAANSSAGVAYVASDADWSQDKETFVAEWAPRIDAYLAGSPLADTGTIFASAAYDYNVDPRWSPAISCTESSKGAHCFLPYNAWGWGNSSWNSWEEAINAHVYGLARGYGHTITMEAAYKYCPPTAQHWYEATLKEMNSI